MYTVYMYICILPILSIGFFYEPVVSCLLEFCPVVFSRLSQEETTAFDSSLRYFDKILFADFM